MTFASDQALRDGALVRRFGELVRYTVPGDGTIEVTAVFDNPTRSSQVGARSVSGRFPTISVLKSEIPNLQKGDTFEIEGVTYRVKEPNIDTGEVVGGKLEQL